MSEVPTSPYTTHTWSKDAVCEVCAFDGAEWRLAAAAEFRAWGEKHPGVPVPDELYHAWRPPACDAEEAAA